MSAAITNIEQFKARKAELVAKWGEKLFFHSTEEFRAILRDCQPLAKYAKMPVEKIHNALVKTLNGEL